MARNDQIPSAAFIALGLNMTKVMAQYGGSRLALIQDATSYAPYIDRIRKTMTALMPTFVSVFEYEVSEKFGTWYSTTVAGTATVPGLPAGTLPNPVDCRTKIRTLATSYFLNEVRPADILRAQIAAVPESDAG